MDLPALVPPIMSKTYFISSIPISMRRISDVSSKRDIITRLPPPSRDNILNPAVAGLNLASIRPRLAQNIHPLRLYDNRQLRLLIPKRRKQTSQIVCPQLNACSGFRQRQPKHVWLLKIDPQLRRNFFSLARCSAAGEQKGLSSFCNVSCSDDSRAVENPRTV